MQYIIPVVVIVFVLALLLKSMVIKLLKKDNPIANKLYAVEKVSFDVLNTVLGLQSEFNRMHYSRINRYTKEKPRNVLLDSCLINLSQYYKNMDPRRRIREHLHQEYERAMNAIEDALENAHDKGSDQALMLLQAFTHELENELNPELKELRDIVGLNKRIKNIRIEAEYISVAESFDDSDFDPYSSAADAAFFSAQKPTFYDILGVPKDATLEQIKRIYKNLCRIYHPDAQYLDENHCKRKMQEITEAYETLKDPQKRQDYDLSIT